MLRLRAALVAAAVGALAAPVSANASIGFRAESHATASAAHSVTVTAPPGVTPGDVMVATLAVGGPRIALAADGWTAIRTTDPGAALDQLSFYRVATASEPASYTFAAASGSDDIAAGIVAYSGVDAANPVDAVADVKGAAATAIPSVTTTASGDVVVGVVAVASTVTVTPDAGVTPRFRSAVSKAGVTAGDFPAPDAGSTPAHPFTTSGKPGEKSAQAIALRAGAETPPGEPGAAPGTLPVPDPGWSLASGAPVTADILASLPVLGPARPVSHASVVRLRVDCPATAAAACAGSIELDLLGVVRRRSASAARRRKLAPVRRFRLAPGQSANVALRLYRRTIRRFARRRRTISVALHVTVQTGAGPAVKTTRLTIAPRRTARRFRPARRH